MWVLKAFIAMLILNALWTFTVRKLARDQVGTALVTDAALVACQGVVTVTYAEHGLIVIVPAVLGSTLGLWAASFIDRWQNRKRQGER